MKITNINSTEVNYLQANQQPPSNSSQRRYLTSVNSFTSNSLHFRNPWITAWWSAAFPGFGHFMSSSYIIGFILMTVEYIINAHIHLNWAIYYSLIGEFELAKKIIDMTWFFAYVSIYVFSIWDSYRRTVDLNKEFQLAYKETTKIKPFQFTAMEINILVKK
jgi:hypothetical protein